MKIKISIIIPVYNVEKYLKECLDSLRHLYSVNRIPHYGYKLEEFKYILDFYENSRKQYFNTNLEQIFFRNDEKYAKNRKKLSFEYLIRKIRRLYYGN